MLHTIFGPLSVLVFSDPTMETEKQHIILAIKVKWVKAEFSGIYDNKNAGLIKRFVACNEVFCLDYVLDTYFRRIKSENGLYIVVFFIILPFFIFYYKIDCNIQ